ncbi:MAG: hypothetical protein ACK4K7_08245 [Allosphingosinicella sp.]|uniref:hypothetical protein n=1 Tax=Allosphingosinicella sp. TaxID=2823234 RepID=UPI00392B5611
MTAQERDEDLPLHEEAKAREKWRGGETLIDGGGKDTGRPASEVDDAAAGGGGGGVDVGHDGRPGTGRPGNFPPPD